MAGWLTRVGDTAKSTWNVVKSIGPHLLSLSEHASKRYFENKEKCIRLEVGKELLLGEVKTLGEVRRGLLDRFVASKPEERISIRRDLDEVVASLRQIKLATLSLGYMEPSDPSLASDGQSAPDAAKTEEISNAWIDRFNQLARAANEQWREDLLARALAVESASPGTVGSRTLWAIGTLEERTFNAFAAILDLSTSVANGLMIPFHQDFLSEIVPESPFGPKAAFGHLLYLLDDVGLVADPNATTRTIPKGAVFQIGYGGRSQIVECRDRGLDLRGIIATSLGSSIAMFYRPKVNVLGERIFLNLMDTLRGQGFVLRDS